jgi:hypothetical protein
LNGRLVSIISNQQRCNQRLRSTSRLKDANFDELLHDDVEDARHKRTVPVEVKAEHPSRAGGGQC